MRVQRAVNILRSWQIFYRWWSNKLRKSNLICQHTDVNMYRMDFLFYMKRLPFDEKISSSRRAWLPFSADQSYTTIAPTTYTTALPIFASRLANGFFRLICFTYTVDLYTDSKAVPIGDVPKLPFLNSNRLDPRVGPWNHPRRLIAPLARSLELLAVVSNVEFWHFTLVSGRNAGWSLGRDSFPLRKWPVIHSLRRTETSSRVRSNAESIKSGPDRHSFYVYIHLPVRENTIGDICAIHIRVGWNFMWLRFSSATYRDSWHDNTRMRIGGIRKWWIILSEISSSLTGCMHVHPSCYLL